MTNPVAQAGGTSDPSEFAALAMDEQFTGLFTQRNPLRDADVPYLYRKFYSAGRIDSIIDGINRENSPKLTDTRRAGSSPFNTHTFPAGNSWYSFKPIQNNAVNLRVMYDGVDGGIYDATPGQKTLIFTKTGLPAAPTTFVGDNTALFMGDGTDFVKWLQPGPWQANKKVEPGTLITSGADPGTMQMALGGITVPVVASQYVAALGQYVLWIGPQQIPLQLANLQAVSVQFSGLVAASALNGGSYVISVVSGNAGIITVTASGTGYARTAEATGVATTGNGTTGGTTPAFVTTQFGLTGDAGQVWKCYGPAVQQGGLATPTQAPTATPFAVLTGPLARWWQPQTSLPTWYAILDANGNVQVNQNNNVVTGFSYPPWAPEPATTIAQTTDGQVVWNNWGAPGSWAPTTAFGNVYTQTAVILDSNGNWQLVTAGNGGNSGGAAPAWGTTLGATVTDGALTWTCLGPGALLTTASISYAFSLHSVDGTVSAPSNTCAIQGPIVGLPLTNTPSITYPVQTYLLLMGAFTYDQQVDQVWIWRTAQGQSTLIFEDAIPVDPWAAGGAFTYHELGIPDVSSAGQPALVAQIPAPIESGPAPTGARPVTYHLSRLWAIVNNILYWSEGPDAVTGNGDTQWNALDFVAIPEIITDAWSTTTTRGPTILIAGTTNVWVVYGTGTASDPFTEPSIYMERVGFLSRNCMTRVGSTVYGLTTNLKCVSLDPSGGYQEIGFPIGDQLLDVTTGAGDAPTGTLYNPATSFVTWHEESSPDTGLYVADGAVGWFRYSPVAPPESGSLWSVRAAIVGGTSCVQSIETSPGKWQLLIAPKTSGEILFRDSSVNGDWNGSDYVGYPSWTAKGSITLCETGEVAEIAHIALKSTAIDGSARPLVSLLVDEIAAGVKVGDTITSWDNIPLVGHTEDPIDLPPSITMYSDRYKALCNGETVKCHNFQLKIDYGTQQYPDELLKFAVYGAVWKERKQQ